MPFVNIQILKGHPQKRKDEISRRVVAAVSESRNCRRRRSGSCSRTCRRGLVRRRHARRRAQEAGGKEMTTSAQMTQPRDPRPGISQVVGDTVAFEQLATGFLFTEGPLWHARENYLLFSDMPGDHLRKWTARDGVRRSASRARSRTAHLGPPGPAARVRARDEQGDAHRARRNQHRACEPPRGQGAEQPQRHRREVGRRHLFQRPDLRPQRVLRQSASAAASLPRRLPRRARAAS